MAAHDAAEGRPKAQRFANENGWVATSQNPKSLVSMSTVSPIMGVPSRLEMRTRVTPFRNFLI